MLQTETFPCLLSSIFCRFYRVFKFKFKLLPFQSKDQTQIPPICLNKKAQFDPFGFSFFFLFLARAKYIIFYEIHSLNLSQCELLFSSRNSWLELLSTQNCFCEPLPKNRTRISSLFMSRKSEVTAVLFFFLRKTSVFFFNLINLEYLRHLKPYNSV